MEEWEEERGSLVASKQEAERLSRSAENEVARVLTEVAAFSFPCCYSNSIQE